MVRFAIDTTLGISFLTPDNSSRPSRRLISILFTKVTITLPALKCRGKKLRPVGLKGLSTALNAFIERPQTLERHWSDGPSLLLLGFA